MGSGLSYVRCDFGVRLMRKLFATVFCAATILANGASASTFDFAALAPTDPDEFITGSLVETSGGLTVTVTPNSNSVVINHDGLGVGTGVNQGMAGSETLTFSFSQPVTLLSLSLTEIGAPIDSAEIASGSLTASTGNFNAGPGIDGGNGVNSTRLITSFIGDDIAFVSMFTIGVETGNFTVAGFEVAPVPLPAGIALMLTVMGGLGLAARRRSTAA